MSKRLMLSIVLVVAIVGGYYLYRMFRPTTERLSTFRAWRSDPAAHPEWRLTAGSRSGDAPFIFPTDGMVGFLWDDSFRPGHRHQGLDIFGGEGIGVTPVVAAYPGYLTRLPEWKSSVIMRIPPTRSNLIARFGPTTLTWRIRMAHPTSQTNSRPAPMRNSSMRAPSWASRAITLATRTTRPAFICISRSSRMME